MSSLDGKVIVTIAPTGGFLTRAQHPFVPTQPADIAVDVARCADAGASMAALHARRLDDQATCDAAIYRDINARVRELSDVVVNNSTGGGADGDMLLTQEDGSRSVDWEARIAGVDGGADTCTLDAITANVRTPHGEVLMNTPQRRAAELLRLMRARGIKPEWEAFSPAHLTGEIAQLLANGEDAAPFLVNLILGLDHAFQNAMAYSPRTLQFMIDMAPADAVISVSVAGHQQMRGLTHALLLGAHVRVGIEDNSELQPGVPAENVRLVEHIVKVVELLGLQPATPAETRQILGLAAVQEALHV
jgi:3-keto-5-aminohexanoate cleavage enzyme